MNGFVLRLSAMAIGLSFVSQILAVDSYFQFPSQSSAGSVLFETKRKACVFTFGLKENKESFQYLEKGVPSILITGIREMEFVFVENLKPQVIYHEFGPNPTTSLQDRVDAEAELFKKKQRPIKNFKELEELKKGSKSLATEKDPRFLPLKVVDFFEESAVSLNKAPLVAQAKDCDYVVLGELSISGGNLNFEVLLYSSWEGKSISLKHQTSLSRAYQEMQPLVLSLKKSLHGRPTGYVSVGVNDPEVIPLVYLNGVFLGKPPFSRKEFIEGVYECFVFKEGYLPFKTQIKIEPGKEISINYNLTKIPSNAQLTVITDIPDAEVYLGIQFLGKTPLYNVSVPTGPNRLRISKEGYVDVFRGVHPKPEKETTVEAILRQGDTETYYATKQNVFLDYTYKDFATYSLYGTLLFYAGYLYFNLESRKALEAARPQVQITNATAIQTFAQSNDFNTFAAWAFWQNQIISDAESKARHYKDIAGTLPIENRRNRQLVGGGMVVGMGLALVTAFSFFILGLDEESFDIGFQGQGLGGKGSFPLVTSETQGFFQYNKRF